MRIIIEHVPVCRFTPVLQGPCFMRTHHKSMFCVYVYTCITRTLLYEDHHKSMFLCVCLHLYYEDLVL